MLNRFENTEYPRATIVVYTQEYPITLAMVGTGQRSRLNARCLPTGTEEKLSVSNKVLLSCFSPSRKIKTDILREFQVMFYFTIEWRT